MSRAGRRTRPTCLCSRHPSLLLARSFRLELRRNAKVPLLPLTGLSSPPPIASSPKVSNVLMETEGCPHQVPCRLRSVTPHWKSFLCPPSPTVQRSEVLSAAPTALVAQPCLHLQLHSKAPPPHLSRQRESFDSWKAPGLQAFRGLAPQCSLLYK